MYRTHLSVVEDQPMHDNRARSQPDIEPTGEVRPALAPRFASSAGKQNARNVRTSEQSFTAANQKL
jgi:hypothetical protein